MLKASKHEAPLKIRSPLRRAVKDDDVDRSQVHGRQRPEPSDTNSPTPFRQRNTQGVNLTGGHTDRKSPIKRKATNPCSSESASSKREARARLPLPPPSFYLIRHRAAARRSPVTENKTQAAIARGFHLFPFRTEKLNPAAPMVLRKRESR